LFLFLPLCHSGIVIELPPHMKNLDLKTSQVNTGLLLLLLFIYLIRANNMLAYAQFSHEDGLIFFQDAFQWGFRSIFHPYHGYFHTIQRIIAYVSSLLPMDFAPYIFNFSAFFINFLPVVLIFSDRTDKLFDNYHQKFVFSLIYLLCPANSPVFITLTNIQWYLPIWVLIYLLADKSRSRNINIAEYILLSMVVITGPFIIIIFPIYLILLYFKKVRLDRIATIIIVIGVIIQTVAVLNYPKHIDYKNIQLWLLPIEFSAKIFWNSLLGTQGQRFFLEKTTIYDYNLLIYIGFIIWAATTFFAVKSKNLFIQVITGFSFLVSLSGIIRTETNLLLESITGGIRFYMMSVFTLIYSYFYLFNTRSNYFFLALFIGCMTIAVPFDFRNRRMTDLDWHGNVEKYYKAKAGQKVSLEMNPPIKIWNMKLKKKLGDIPFFTSGQRSIDIPKETNNITYYIQLKETEDVLYIDNGWAFVEGRNTTGNKVYIVLTSQQNIYVFDTEPKDRHELGNKFSFDYIIDAGFKFIIPKKELAEGNYRVGLLIFNSPGGFKFNREEKFRGFQYTKKSIDHSNQLLEQTINGTLNIPKPSKIDKLPEESGNVQYYLQVQQDNQSIIINNGWAFIENQDAEKYEKQIVLESERNIYMVNTESVKRYELVKKFNSPKYLYAGFQVNIPQHYFKKDTYKIGILFIKDSKIIGFKRTEKEVKIGQ